MTIDEREARAFIEAGRRTASEARQRAALQLSCGIDLDEAERAAPPARRAFVVRLERELRRERLKGLNRHWSYDLNRHIALKQALDRLAPQRSRDGSLDAAERRCARPARQRLKAPARQE